MDMTAYMKIGDLDEVARANGIEVPRLRGYRLMSLESPWSEKDIEKEVENELEHAFRSLADSAIRMAEAAFEYDIRRFEAEESWLSPYERLCRGFEERFKAQAEMWNKYAGKSDVLYIHSRMGGSELYHWDEEARECVTDYDLKDQPWFLDYVHDAYDSTYIDIYARIDPATVKKEE